MLYNEGYVHIIDKAPPIFFRSWAPSEEKKADLICVHGAGGNSADFSKIARTLCNQSYAIKAFDFPGSGFSPAANVEAKNRLILDINILSAFVSQSAGPKAIICSSAGAIFVFSYLYGSRKDPVTSRIPVIFSEPSFGYDEETKQYIDSCFGFLSKSFANLDEALYAWDASPFAQIKFDNDDDKRAFILGRLHPNGESLTPLASGIVGVKKKILSNLKYFKLLENKLPIENPTLILWGAKGRLKNKHQQQAQKVFARLSTCTIEAGGHPLSLTCNEEIAALLEFLRDLHD